ncbi:MAG: 1,4-dihydroxy-2-naphthoate polyprenyltransferase [Candidatus Omnitrophica bacterium]|nr:1,4-dihydroxy-2-naphthoate polyprenyltransferase [Candidatus Omnitrophota bacterium]
MNPWLLAIRPKTLPAGFAPVLIGSAMAFGDGGFHAPTALACLIAALLIQIGTNLANDYFDFQKGADVNRVGPIRVTQAGLIKPAVVLTATIIVFTLAALLSAYLVCRGGYILGIIAVASIISGILYTAGPKPLGYLGLGEIFVFIFFGPVAVAGTYYVQTLDMNWAVVAAGLAPGFLSCAILAVNNLRDIEGDRKAGKMTLAVRLGRDFSVCEYLFFILATTISPFLVFIITHDHVGIVAASIVGFLAMGTLKTVITSTDNRLLNKALAKTGLWLVIYSVLFSGGWILCSH